MTKISPDNILEGLKDKKGKDDKPVYTASFPDLVDLVENDGEVKFLTFDGETYSEREIDGQRFLPPRKVDWLLPRLENVMREYRKHTDTSDAPVRSDSNVGGDTKICKYCDEELYSLISTDYFPKYSQMPTQYHYDYLTWVAFSSYIIEKFDYSPILFLVSNTGRGKTPTLKALCHISRRGIFTETFREANIIRWGNDYEASLFFDVTNLPKKIDKNDAEDLIYGRAERGVTSSRVLYPEKGPFQDMVTLSIFGVTGATSNRDIDNITAERCFTVHMPFSTKIFPYPHPKDGLEIKEKLTAFRMAHFNTSLNDINKQKPGKLEDYLLGYQQMIKTFFPSHEDDFNEFKKAIKEDRHERTEGSFEARIVKLIESLKDQVENGSLCLTYDIICDEYNLDKEKKLTGQAMSSIVRKLGFIPKRNTDGDKRGIFFDQDLITNLKELYGIDDKLATPKVVSEDTEASEATEITENDLEELRGDIK